MINRQWIFASVPTGSLTEESFAFQEAAVPAAGPGEALIRTRFLSIDPANRAWMSGETYRDQLEPGTVMPGFAIGEVIASNTAECEPGDIVEANLGWQEFSAMPARALRRRDKALPIEHMLGALGMTGLTAYFGMIDIGRPRPGETIVVSAAAGGVGSLAGQIGRIAGCRVVGIAGGPEKVRWLTDHLGFDAAVDYRAADFVEQLRGACPDGVDVYFDNTGGPILEAVLQRANNHARVVACGAIAGYDGCETGREPRVISQTIVVKRIRMEGFIVADLFGRRQPAEAALQNWLASGQLKAPLCIEQGLENAPKALVGMLAGRNRGKALVKVSG